VGRCTVDLDCLAGHFCVENLCADLPGESDGSPAQKDAAAAKDGASGGIGDGAGPNATDGVPVHRPGDASDADGDAAPDAAAGQPCDRADQCPLGRCTDGHCCIQTCTPCQACTGPSGTC